MAMESQDQTKILDSITDIIQTCVLEVCENCQHQNHGTLRGINDFF
jgi:hypothetical protein